MYKNPVQEVTKEQRFQFESGMSSRHYDTSVGKGEGFVYSVRVEL